MYAIKLGRMLTRSMTTLNAAALKVEHDSRNKEFFIEIKGCTEKAFLSYDFINDSTIDLQHTVVPEAFRGQGVAKLLAKAALDHVVEENLNMQLTCWYLQKYVKENSREEYTKRLLS